MSIKKINWLGECDKCGTELAMVWTESDDEDKVDSGDYVMCCECRNSGEVEVSDGCAFVVWESHI